MKKLWIWIVTVIAIIVIGLLLLLAVFSIDASIYSKHFEDSAELLKNEETYEKINGERTSVLDNFTDSIMILNATYRGNESIWDKTINVYRPFSKDKDPREVLVSLNDKIDLYGKTEYFRYWHGYLIILKFLLLIMNYGQIRIFNTIFQLLLTGILLWLMYKNGLGKYIIPFISAYLIINPFSMFLSMQNSTIWYIVLISCITYMIFKDNIDKHNLHYLLFTIIGMLTAFFDFLTYPIATFGILMIFILLSENLNGKNALIKIVLCGISWFMGYSIMWGTKWVLAYLVNGNVVVENIYQRIITKTTTESGKAFNVKRYEVIPYMFKIFNTKSVIIVLSLNLLNMFLLIAHKIKNKCRINISKSIYVLATGFVSLIWYYIVYLHSYVHAESIAFRTAVVFWFALLAGMYRTIFDTFYCVTVKGDGEYKE